ncbi:MAG: Fur family transcriptional regulator, partial [Candidatus Binatia bacterium]
VFFAHDGHFSVEELYGAVRRKNPRVGYATVYRTLKLLKECGLAAERHFDDGQARFEAVEEEAQHHDHIICERCGKIVEFNSEELERHQERIARFLGFVVSHHRMELYGICADCREGKRSVGGAKRSRGRVQQL